MNSKYEKEIQDAKSKGEDVTDDLAILLR